MSVRLVENIFFQVWRLTVPFSLKIRCIYMDILMGSDLLAHPALRPSAAFMLAEPHQVYQICDLSSPSPTLFSLSFSLHLFLYFSSNMAASHMPELDVGAQLNHSTALSLQRGLTLYPECLSNPSSSHFFIIKNHHK